MNRLMLTPLLLVLTFAMCKVRAQGYVGDPTAMGQQVPFTPPDYWKVSRFGLPIEEYKCENKTGKELPEGYKKAYPEMVFVGYREEDKKIRHVYYDAWWHTLIVFDDQYSTPPTFIPWLSDTDVRWKDPITGQARVLGTDINSGMPNSWDEVLNYQKKGVKEWLITMNVYCDSTDQNTYGMSAASINNSVFTNWKPFDKDKCAGKDVLSTPTSGTCCEETRPNRNEASLICRELERYDADSEECSGLKACANEEYSCMPFDINKDLFRNDLEARSWFLDGDLKIMNQNPGALKAGGEACTFNRECKSYDCYRKKCRSKERICRHARTGERISTNQKCESGSFPDQNGICKAGPAVGYVGMIDEFQDPELDTKEKYRMDIPEERQALINYNLMYLRTLEYFYNRVYIKDKSRLDCFKVNEYMSQELFIPFFDKHRVALENYNKRIHLVVDAYKKITSLTEAFKMYKDAGKNEEKKAKALKEIKDKFGTNLETDEIVLPVEDPKSDDTRTLKVLAFIQEFTDGKEALRLMRKRNEIFLEFELAMMEATNEIATKLMSLNENMQQWKNSTRGPWTLITEGNEVKKKTDYWHCDAKWIDIDGLSADDIGHYEWTEQLYNTWYEFDTNKDGTIKNSGNTALWDDENIAGPALIMLGLQNASVFKKSYNIIDPLTDRSPVPGISMSAFGEEKNMTDGKVDWSDKFFGLDYNLDYRYYRKLNGKNNGTLSAIRTAFRNDLNTFYSTLKKDPTQSRFYHEPELVGIGNENCGNKGGEDLEGCEQYKQHLDRLANFAFGYFVTHGLWIPVKDQYGRVTENKMSNFFNSPEMGRPHSMMHAAVSLNNLSGYYADISKRRKLVNDDLDGAITHAMGESCDKKVRTQAELIANKCPTTGEGGSGAGTPPGAIAETTGGAADSGIDGGLGRTGSKTDGPKSERVAGVRGNYHVDPQALNGGGKFASFGGNKGGYTTAAARAAAVAKVSAAFRKRTAKMKAFNDTLKGRGVDVDALNKKHLAAVTKSSAGGIGATGASGASGSAASLGSGTGAAGNAQLSKDDMGNKGSGIGTYSAPATGANQDKASSGYGAYSDGTEAVGGQGLGNAGLSDADAEHTLNALDRSKSHLNPNEDDGLFGVVSKAYMRNLDKVLIRKKPEERPKK